MVVFLISLAILLIIFLLQILYFFGFLKKAKIFKSLFWLIIFIAVLIFIYLIFLQAKIWQESSFSRFLVPPYKPFSFVIFYVLSHFGMNYLISLGAALIFLIVSISFNNFFQKRFFEDEEPYLGSLAIFILSYPYFLYYLVFVLGFGLLRAVFIYLIKKKKNRLSFYYLWLPLAIFTIIIKIWLIFHPLN